VERDQAQRELQRAQERSAGVQEDLCTVRQLLPLIERRGVAAPAPGSSLAALAEARRQRQEGGGAAAGVHSAADRGDLPPGGGEGAGLLTGIVASLRGDVDSLQGQLRRSRLVAAGGGGGGDGEREASSAVAGGRPEPSPAPPAVVPSCNHFAAIGELGEAKSRPANRGQGRPRSSGRGRDGSACSASTGSGSARSGMREAIALLSAKQEAMGQQLRLRRGSGSGPAMLHASRPHAVACNRGDCSGSPTDTETASEGSDESSERGAAAASTSSFGTARTAGSPGEAALAAALAEARRVVAEGGYRAGIRAGGGGGGGGNKGRGVPACVRDAQLLDAVLSAGGHWPSPPPRGSQRRARGRECRPDDLLRAAPAAAAAAVEEAIGRGGHGW
jgi:hypothetical protein